MATDPQQEIKRREILSDIGLWIVLLVVVIWGSQYLYDLANHERQTIVLPFHDANEIVRGTNVRLMGVDVGFVDDIQIQDDHVDVVIRMSRNVVKIPEGAVATIKFTGLVGSKSLEITPPDHGNGLKPIEGASGVIVEEPIRLRDTIQYNIDIANALRRGAENFSDFFGRRKPIEELQYNALVSRRKTNQAIVHVNNGLTRLAEFHQRMDASRNDYRVTLYNLEATTAHAAELMDARIFSPSVGPVLNYFDDVFREMQAGFQRFKDDGYESLHARIGRIRTGFVSTSQRISNWDAVGRVGHFNAGLDEWHEAVASMDRLLQGEDPLPRIQRARRRVQQANQKLDDLNRQF